MSNIKVSLKLVEDEIYSKRKTVRYDIRDLTVESIVSKYSESIEDDDEEEAKVKYNYIYIPEYQRDFTWDSIRQSKLIESIVLGLPIPFIFVAENKDSSWEIIDGSQRIRTLHAFINNELCLEGLMSLQRLNGYHFNELDLGRQGKVLNTALRIIVLSEETTDDVKKDMFERINRGSDLLKPMEKRKGIYEGIFTSFIYDYCKNNSSFTDLVKVDKWLVNRQEHEELLLRFFALSDSNTLDRGISTGISSYLDTYLQDKNDELEQMSPEEKDNALNEYKNRINCVVKYVEDHFPYGFRHASNPQTKRSVFEAISVGVWKAIKEGKASSNIDKELIRAALSSKEFKEFTHVANELHKKQKLNGRVTFIYNLVCNPEKYHAGN